MDLAGTVEAVGPNVTRFKPGDEVFGGAPASFAEYVLAREDRLLLKPRGLSFEQAASVNVAGRTALQGVRDHAQVKPGQRVLIHGAGGGVGTFAKSTGRSSPTAAYWCGRARRRSTPSTGTPCTVGC